MNPLTPRENEIAQLIAAGRSNQAIADTFGTSLNTVKRQVSSILEKTGCASRVQIALWTHNLFNCREPLPVAERSQL